MSSIEKALERLIAKKNVDIKTDGFGNIEDIDKTVDQLETKVPAAEAMSPAVDAKKQESIPAKPRADLDVQQFKEKRICHLDFTKMDEAGFLVPDTSRRRLSEEYRIIKRPILMNAFGHGAAPVDKGNLVGITSARTNEGKTYTTLNLAISLAMELDITILLVDTDLLKCSLTKQLGLENEPGLMDVVKSSSMDLSDVILATDLPRLKVLPAGTRSKNPTEILASTRMRNMINEMSDRYSDRIILFDTPPLMETTEGNVIVNFIGQVLVVVESSVTPSNIVKDAVSQISSDKVIGMILNKSRQPGSGGYYGGHYGEVLEEQDEY